MKPNFEEWGRGMERNRLQGEGHGGVRAFLRVVGPLFLLAGGGMLAVALIDFFSAFGTMRPPRLFFLGFIGMPLLAIGSAMCKFGYMGAALRYMAGETAPVARDTVNYMVEGTEESVRTVARSVGEGLGAGIAAARGTAGTPGAGGGAGALVRCRKCNADNDADARFCDGCGAALVKDQPCPDCGEPNDADAQFCDRCGRALES
jgi:hypothetical protein